MASPKSYRMMNFVENNLALFLVAIVIILVERVVKFYITESLRLGESIPVIGNFLMITRAENSGAAFGILQGFNLLFLIAAIAVFGMIIVYYQKIIYDRLLVFASAFILGGTVGNMMDRLFFGVVIDYINIGFWPTFNISDAALTIGVALLAIYLYFWQKEPKATRQASLIKY
ncbi:signal peptidase II [Candidatus Woesearchaeota archaeon]|nr:signal peptidase II [Candidatus Woesearchaeota archaeon]